MGPGNYPSPGLPALALINQSVRTAEVTERTGMFSRAVLDRGQGSVIYKEELVATEMAWRAKALPVKSVH